MDHDIDVYGYNIERRGVKCARCKKNLELDEYCIRFRKSYSRVMVNATLCTRCAMDLGSQLQDKAVFAGVGE